MATMGNPLAFPAIWSEDAPPEVYLVGSAVPVWAGGMVARVTGEATDGRPVYTIEDARGREVGRMTDDGQFTEL